MKPLKLIELRMMRASLSKFRDTKQRELDALKIKTASHFSSTGYKQYMYLETHINAMTSAIEKIDEEIARLKEKSEQHKDKLYKRRRNPHE